MTIVNANSGYIIVNNEIAANVHQKAKGVCMKNKCILIGMILVAFLVLFVSCDDVQKVKISPDSVSEVKNFSATLDSDTPDQYILRWDAVDRASHYVVYFKQDGKKTAVGKDGILQGYGKIGDDGVADDADYDTDKCYAIVNLYDDCLDILELPLGTFSIRLGVKAIPNDFDIMSGIRSSDIVWSDPITFDVKGR